MKKILYIILASFILISCEDQSHAGHDHEGHDHSGHEENEHHEEGEITLTEKQKATIDIKTGTFKQLKVSELIETNGELELSAQYVADVHVLMDGIITNINVIEGSKVKKGQILARLKHPEIIKIQEDLISNSAALKYASQEYTRQEKLYSENVGSGREFQKIKAEYDGIKATVNALKAKARMLGLNPEQVITGKIVESLSIRSPLSGRVSIVGTNIGQYVSTDKRLFQVVDNSQLHCAFRVYENDILSVKVGQEALVSPSAFSNESFTATISSISPSFEGNPKSVHVQAVFKDHDKRLISGMYVSGKIKTDSITRFVLPRAAIVAADGKKFVFIQQPAKPVKKHEDHEGEPNHAAEDTHDNETNYKKVAVTTGIEENDWVEILNRQDFEPKAKIALSSAYYLQAEIGKGETAHVH